MAFVHELLGRDENILYATRQHILVLISRILTGLALIAVLVAAGVVSNTAFSYNNDVLLLGLSASEVILLATFVISVFVLISIFGSFLRWNAEQYLVTDRRVIQIRGAFGKTVIDSSLGKINDVALRQSFLGRLFNFGTIEILTGAEEAINVMDGMQAPLDFKRSMLDAKYEYDRGYGYLDPQAAYVHLDQPVPAEFEIQRALEELARLRDRGILSSEEFEQKKRELLTRI